MFTLEEARHLFVIDQLQQKQIDGRKLGKPFSKQGLSLDIDGSKLRIPVDENSRHIQIILQEFHVLFAEIIVLIEDEPSRPFVIFSFQQKGLAVELAEHALHPLLIRVGKLADIFKHFFLLTSDRSAAPAVSVFFPQTSWPASIIGMILLFFCLAAGILKIEHIQEKADFLLENMSFFFIPAGVSIINYLDILENALVQLIVICAVSTVITFVVTAYTVTFTMRLLRRRKKS